jgi:hypothetical protein
MSPAPLTSKQVGQFDQEGFLVVDDVFTEADFQPVRDEITAEIDRRAASLLASGELSRDYAEEDFEHRLTRISAETDKIAVAIWNGTLAGPAFFSLLTHPVLLDIAEQFCGPELIASSVYRLRPKIPGHRMGPVPWHQDSGYFEPYCDNALVLTVWLPLVDATAENGCMWVQPGVHKGEIVRHQQSRKGPYLEIPDEDLPLVDAVCVTMRKGSVLLLTNRTPHATFENTTDTVRWSMDLRYQSAVLPTNAPISRLDGESVPDAENGVPIACYPPEADFLVRSQLRPSEVVTDPSVFHDLRTQHQSRPVTARWK